MTAGRLILDGLHDGAVNMARDEALLEACGSDSTITLRFYGWSRPTISLGYFQDYGDYECLEPPAGILPVVRRSTGGGAILHDLEITYSLVLPLSHPLVNQRPNNLYSLAHQAIITAIGHGACMISCREAVSCGESARRGPFFCFARRHALDVLVPRENGIAGFSKLAGSAQRRTRIAILQHGSIMLDSRFPQQPVATWLELTGQIGFERAMERLVPKFEEMLGISTKPGSMTSDELEAANRLQAKYAGREWTGNRTREAIASDALDEARASV